MYLGTRAITASRLPLRPAKQPEPNREARRLSCTPAFRDRWVPWKNPTAPLPRMTTRLHPALPGLAYRVLPGVPDRTVLRTRYLRGHRAGDPRAGSVRNVL